MESCMASGIHAVVCESPDEVARLEEIAGREEVPVLPRINPDFHTKESAPAVGGEPRRFGIDADVLRRSRELVIGLRRVRVHGFHAYMGTRFLNADALVHNTREILAPADESAERLGIELRTVDFDVAYCEDEKDLDLEATDAGINDVVAPFAKAHPGCLLINELGRCLAATCGAYVVRALYVEESMGEQFVIADGGTDHHIAAVGIGGFVKRNFTIRSLTRYDDKGAHSCTVTGPLCTPDDVIGKKVQLPRGEAGDLLGVERSGAYEAALSEVLERTVTGLTEDVHLFEDLHLDSTSILEILMTLEDAVDPEELDVDDFKSGGTLTGYVLSQQATSGV
ncbi:diaminopimelate decarboxylase [Streptomyces sp. MMS24-I29]|uniref:diaminopimelate decarboxylase n=1 Tax=Streptomyces sp. MMS24-I29 TaxID=3351480 RepID=UPI003C7A347C